MNQLALILKESNQRMRLIMAKGASSTDYEKLREAREEAKVQLKAVSAYISAYAVYSKNKRAKIELEQVGAIDGHTLIDGMESDPEVDKVKCPILEKIIIRQECLDYSGTHYDECRGCHVGVSTKQLLLKDAVQP